MAKSSLFNRFEMFSKLFSIFFNSSTGGTPGWLQICLILYSGSMQPSNFHASAGNIHVSSLQTIARLTLTDGAFQNVMHALSRRSAQISPQHSIGGNVARQLPPLVVIPTPTSNSASHLQFNSNHNGLPVCLRYLSALGCPAGTSTRFSYGARAHVAPESLGARVKGHIIQRMGAPAKTLSTFEDTLAVQAQTAWVKFMATQRVPRVIPPVDVSLNRLARVRVCLSLRLQRDSIQNTSTWWRPLGLPVSSHRDAGTIKQEAIANYVSRLGLSLVEIVRLRRGEVDDDLRPNKGLDPVSLANSLQGYPHVDLLVRIACSRIQEWFPRRTPPNNHRSARQFQPALLKSVREGQATGTYLVVNLSREKFTAVRLALQKRKELIHKSKFAQFTISPILRRHPPTTISISTVHQTLLTQVSSILHVGSITSDRGSCKEAS
ncbi:LOW QUALITY PROTEIN: hypothetical protein PHMEG_00010320 [Phytophthora megakarya]|uniref:Uncharacterized protein n=1 Tax=Phytophthora megakarya TaxID=4795 RepID=A0A225WEZ4_9STRA|nr:LOW QUALITY PROTEIN: hypothetical protein PHMEG_00010320 [Phytophthora megakarya]